LSRVAEYKDWIKDKEETLPLFLRPWWLDAVCLPDHWDVCIAKNKDNKITAVMPYYRFRKKGIDVIGMPFLTPYMGIHLQYPEGLKLHSRYDFEKEMLDQLISHLPVSTYLQQKFYPELTYGLPFYWKGFRLDWRYTYHLSLKHTETEIWQQMEGSARTQLQKTMKLVTVQISEEERDIAIAYELVKMTFMRQGKKAPYTLPQFQRLYTAVKAHGAGDIYLARLVGDQTPVACMFMVKDRHKVYNLVLGRDHTKDPGGSIHGILWTCIQKHIDRHETFDFEGSMLEGPERMFRSFGSVRMPVLQVTKYQNRWWKALFAITGY
jgi:hypothetical protein